jgi:isoleucyl-tRNA synthetase
MPFDRVPNKVNFIDQEYKVIKFWKDTDAFQKRSALHKGKKHWSFIDGPITANNPMGVHHGWGRTYKDLYIRYKTMLGHELRYQNGFDCQGLWVEVEVERELGFGSKQEIEEFGLAKFVQKCKERVLRYAAIQTEQSIRLGYWMDWNTPDQLRMLADKLVEDPSQEITIDGVDGPLNGSVEAIVGILGLPETGGSYFTFSNENNYMIWTFLNKCWQKGWIYKGADVMPWCPRCATAITQHEIATDGYQVLTHPSVTLRFPLRGCDNESLLVWTTTPWTLTSNVAAAVGPDLVYVKVKQGEEIFYLSRGTLHMLHGDYQVLSEIKGEAMEGWEYDGPYDDLHPVNQTGGFTDLLNVIQEVTQTAAEAHRVILWDEVGEHEGTGIVHIAPGCGAEDFQLGKEENLPVIVPIDEMGNFVEGFGWLSGMNVSVISNPIFEDLDRKGLKYDVEDYTHRYPTCWRCQTELVFRLVDEWFINMGQLYDKPRDQLTLEEKENSLRYQIMDVVDKIRWIPEFGHARELDWLRNMGDWMISKKRYWGLALPIWTCDECDNFEVIKDDKELKERAVEGWDVLGNHTPHRPYIDAIKITCSNCGSLMNRIHDVGDPWLDAGIVPFSTLAYRNDPEFWGKWYPAAWISESFPGQFRNWFYSLLAMATVMDNSPPFLENFGYATLLAEDGREMHKSWGNSIEFNEAADRMGVDVMRWLFCAHKPENNLLFGYKHADAVRRRFLIPLWNVYSFFTTYANLDNWEPDGDLLDPAIPEGSTPQSVNPLDRWILSRLNQVMSQVSQSLDNSDSFSATLVIEPLLDDLTNWYVRRSRRRFWKSELDTDKNSAYSTLYHFLVKFTKLLAPFVPFVTEVIYQNLVRLVKKNAHESIHHCDWPTPDKECIDDDLVQQMELARRISSLGLSARSSAGLKVRQPLSKALVFTEESNIEFPDFLVEIVSDELNIKDLEFVSNVEKIITYQVLPNSKLLGPRLGVLFPKVRPALDALDPIGVNAIIQAGESITLDIEEEKVELSPEEILINTIPAEGYTVSSDKMVTVAIDTIITNELKNEGLAREIVRRIQSLRRDADFNIEDRITTYYQTEGDLLPVFETWGEYIKAETLSTSLQVGDPPDEAYEGVFKIDGLFLKMGLICNP